MRNGVISVASGVAVLVLLAFGQVFAQFTQGPPGNPSAAGITTGSPPPVPTPPAVIGPPSAPAPLPFRGTVQRVTDDNAVDTPETLLAAEGMPPVLLEAYRESPLAQYLNLSPEQMDKIASLRRRFFRETRDLRYDLLKKRLDMRRLFADPSADAVFLLSRRQQLSSLRVRIADILVKMSIEARGILKQDQIEMLDSLPSSR